MRPAARHIGTLIKYLEGFVLFFETHRPASSLFDLQDSCNHLIVWNDCKKEKSSDEHDDEMIPEKTAMQSSCWIHLPPLCALQCICWAWNQNCFCYYKHTLEEKKELIFKLSFLRDAKQHSRDASSARKGKECFLFERLLGGGLIIKTNSNWQEIKETVISFLAIVPFIPLADLCCQNG